MLGVHGRRKRAHAQPRAEEVPLFNEREKERLNGGFVGGSEVAVVGDGAAGKVDAEDRPGAGPLGRRPRGRQKARLSWSFKRVPSAFRWAMVCRVNSLRVARPAAMATGCALKGAALKKAGGLLRVVEQVHQVGPAAKGPHRKAAADELAKATQVRVNAVQAL